MKRTIFGGESSRPIINPRSKPDQQSSRGLLVGIQCSLQWPATGLGIDLIDRGAVSIERNHDRPEVAGFRCRMP